MEVKKRNRKIARYLDIKIPHVPEGQEEIYKTFNSNQRRAVIARLILDTGHPRSVSQVALGKKFGITQQRISEDFKVVMPQVTKILKKEGEAVIHAVMNKAIRDCVNGTNAEKIKAAQLAKDYHGMLVESGEIEKAPNEVLNTDIDWSEAYDQAEKELEEEKDE